MSNYSNNPGRVRVDLFRDTGKWYATGSVDMGDKYDPNDLFGAFYHACFRAYSVGMMT
jgi:predicted RNA-binding protein